ncbi:cysteine-rich receptor-like protein kinase 25 [Hevea brasiliensis]|uniref:cysteine-rich receptor-like protein kinase 25 n=1 Tax=Hevea brasiliensis TaxID=3981 RepID=UPI0025EAA603|nr:cysteine-rich receptor-like protein kinase 25 [Hevea brasiliensis]
MNLVYLIPAYNLFRHQKEFSSIRKSKDYSKDLRIRAASADSKFATGKATVNSQTIYALAQCSPGLSKQQCDNCLVAAIGEIQNCCFGNVGGSLIRPSCNFRFEPYMFYTPTADPLPPESYPPPVSPPSREGKVPMSEMPH